MELDDVVGPSDGGNNDNGRARVYFTTRHSAEKAYLSGKSWNGHNLQFSWMKSSSSNQSPLSTSKGNSDAEKPGDGESEKMEIDKESDESKNKE